MNESQLYRTLSNNWYASLKKGFANLIKEKCWIALVYISLIKYEVKYLLMCLLTVCISSVFF